MAIFSALYDGPTTLSAETGHRRIYAPTAYRVVRELDQVPILMSEAMRLGRYYPLCWRSGPAGPRLVALRSFLPKGRGHPRDVRLQGDALPLVLQAYPFIVPDADGLRGRSMTFDDAIADEPSDVGAPILMGDGRIGTAALARCKIAIELARDLPDTLAFTRDVAAAGLLEPWPLRFDLGQGERVDIADLMVLAPDRLGDGAVHDLVSRWGVEGGLFLSLQRASLFRAGALLAGAKQAVTPQVAASPAAAAMARSA